MPSARFEEESREQDQDDLLNEEWEPMWLTEHRQKSDELWGERLFVPEWEEEEDNNDDDTTYRSRNGWKGCDLIHDVNAPVRITEYYVKYGEGQGLPKVSDEDGGAGIENGQNQDDEQQPPQDPQNNNVSSHPPPVVRKGGIGTELTGIVRFTRRAESHKGYCHGGSMCSVMDDVIGWCGFVVTGQCLPWSGFTVQINSNLQSPVPVNTTLLVRARVTNIERRKVSIAAELVVPAIATTNSTTTGSGNGAATATTTLSKEKIYASSEGLVVLNKGILPAFATVGSFHKWPSSVAMT